MSVNTKVKDCLVLLKYAIEHVNPINAQNALQKCNDLLDEPSTDSQLSKLTRYIPILFINYFYF